MNKVTVFESIKIAFNSLTVHKLRSFLTILVIIIGITSVILIFSAGERLRGLINNQLSSWGSDTVNVEVKVPSASHESTENAGGLALGISITTLKREDAEAVKKHPNISEVYSMSMGQEVVTRGEESEIYQLWGVSADFLKIDKSEVATGRFFTDEEDRSLSKVAVIGNDVKEKMFGQSDVLGKSIKIGRLNFKVIGVMAKRGTVMFLNMDEVVYLPLETLQKLIMGVDHIGYFTGQLIDKDQADSTAEDITRLLRERHQITDPIKDDFAVYTMEEAMDRVNTIMGGVTFLLMAIAAISLLVGGVGIMNIMLVSVTERTNEIGLRKALGATEKNIQSQFLWEAVTLTLTGGVAGILLGVFLSYLVYFVAQRQGYDWVFVVQPTAIIIAVGASVIIGLVFGIYPARKAARKNPIEALRFEQ